MLARVVAGVLLFLLFGAAGAETGYTIAVVPRVPPEQAYRDWQPFLDRLSRETGTRLELRLSQRWDEFEGEFLRGVPDFLFLSPFQLVLGRRAQNYQPLVRGTAKPLYGVIVVRTDSPLKSVQDLDGASIAFPGPNAFAASLYLRALLAEREHIRFQPVYVTSHTNALRSVLYGQTPAGGGDSDIFADEPEALRRQLRVVFETPRTVQHAFSSHPRVAPPMRQAVADAILAMDRDAAGRRLLERVGMAKPARADYARDYQNLEALGLDKYVVIGTTESGP